MGPLVFEIYPIEKGISEYIISQNIIVHHHPHRGRRLLEEDV